PSPPAFPVWIKVGLVIVGVLTIFGNGLVIYLIATRHRLRTKTNFMVVSLAVSDLLVGTCIIPSFLACMYVTCDNLLAKLFYDAFLFVSVCNLCCITFDRFLAVTRPLRYHMKITRKSVIAMIMFSWIVPSIASLVPVAWLYTDTSIENQMEDNKIFYTLQVVLFMFFPCLIMLIAYVVIFNIAWKQTRHMRQVMRSVSNVGTGPRSNSIPTSSTREAKATLKVFGTVVVMFVVCWSLSAYRTIVTQYQLMDVPWDLTNASRLLLVANSAINPIIYALWKKDVKNEIRKLLKLNSQLVRPSSATFRSSQDLSRFDSTSSMAEQRRSRANSTQEPASVEKEKKKLQRPKDKQPKNGVIPHGLTRVESVQIKTVEDKATSTRPGGPMTLGIDNLAAHVDGMV
ncbi:trace amine-associated receptor 13c-like, partial [Dendronephthya gigantea]